MVGYLLVAIAAISLAGYLIGRAKAQTTVGTLSELHSLPSFHGGFIAAWIGIPAFILVLLWILFQGTVIDSMLLSSLPAGQTANMDDAQLSLILSEVKSLAAGHVFGEPEPHIVAAAERYNNWYSISRWSMVSVALALCLVALLYTRAQISSRFRARHRVERVLDGVMIACSVLAILTTLGIVLSLLVEALRFFSLVSPLEFFFGLNWEPQIAIRADQVTGGGAFGAIPVFVGTLQIALLAMLVAAPLGLFSAIYLTEYSGPRFRKTIKPLLEVLAGIPTVVYGFFAATTVAPFMVGIGDSLGIPVEAESALAAGLVMGIMIIPFISSLSDDVINSVPQTLRDGSYGLGATRAETITKVVLPAALPGIVSASLLGVSRAVGETMIVVMVVGQSANLTFNPLDKVTTVTVQITMLILGDTEAETAAGPAYTLGFALFAATLALNVFALKVVRKYRMKYD